MASVLQVIRAMKPTTTNSIAYVLRGTLLLPLLAVAALWLANAPGVKAQVQKDPEPANIREAQIIAAFEGRVKEYSSLRERLEDKLPKLPKDATPEQIKAHKVKFEQIVRSARPNAKQGDIFSPDIARYIRSTIRNTYKGETLQALRAEIIEAETQGVPVRVNYTYPESKELLQVPATLLLKLPQLPKQVKYRFVGKHMLLVDRENGLIVDYMLNAFP